MFFGKGPSQRYSTVFASSFIPSLIGLIRELYKYFSIICSTGFLLIFISSFCRLFSHKLWLLSIVMTAAATASFYYIEGPHQQYLQGAEKYLLWCAWWVGLGVLSSVGLGTGLHTFILYLGPHIATVSSYFNWRNVYVIALIFSIYYLRQSVNSRSSFKTCLST